VTDGASYPIGDSTLEFGVELWAYILPLPPSQQPGPDERTSEQIVDLQLQLAAAVRADIDLPVAVCQRACTYAVAAMSKQIKPILRQMIDMRMATLDQIAEFVRSEKILNNLSRSTIELALSILEVDFERRGTQFVAVHVVDDPILTPYLNGRRVEDILH